MAYNLLALITQVCREIHIDAPNAVVGNTDKTIIQLRAFADKVGRDLVREFEWRRLVRENVFETTASRGGTCLVSSANTLTGFSSASSLAATGDIVTGSGIPEHAEVTVVTETQLTLNVSANGSASATTSCTFATQYFDLPAGFDRQVSRTQWDRSDHWGMHGAKSSQEWQWLKGGIISPGPVYRYRIFGNRLKVHPAPGSRLVLSNEFVSNRWISTATAADPTLSSFAADTDVPVFPDDVMVNGVKFHFYKTNGLDWEMPLAEFNRSLTYAKAQDQPAQNLSLAPEPQNILIGYNNIPEGNFPS